MKEWFDQSKTTTTPCGSMSGIWRCLGDHLGFVGFEKLHAFSSAAYGIRDFCLGLTILHACTFLWWTLHSLTFKISIATSVSPPTSCNCSLGHFCRSSDPATNVWASVALWNCGVRPHQPLNPPIFHTSTIWMALTSSAANSGWNFAPLDISHSSLCVPAQGKHFALRLLSTVRESLHQHSLSSPSFPMNLHFHRLEPLWGRILPPDHLSYFHSAAHWGFSLTALICLTIIYALSCAFPLSGT